jgi:hypothetical protein
MSREDVMGALFALAQQATSFKTFSRRLQLSSKVKEFPALYVLSVGENYPPRAVRGLPAKVTIDAQIWIYTNDGGNPDIAPEIPLNNAIDAVEAALQPSVMAGVQTLGLDNNVSHCWIEGQVEKFPGVLDGIAKAIIPVRILLK